MRKEAVVAELELQYQHLLEGTNKTRENPQSGEGTPGRNSHQTLPNI